MKDKRNLYIVVLAAVVVVALVVAAASESCGRFIKNISSNLGGGLNRKVTAYDYNGNVLYEYSGKIDIQMHDTKVLFDTEEGKRVVLYNAIVIAEEQ